MISILMSTYNGAAYLREQLDSILRQEEQDWRLFIRDDGSCDDTPAILAEYAALDVRISVVQGGENWGTVGSFEYLLREYGTGDDIAFADQDDVWFPNKLRVCLSAIRRQESLHGKEKAIVVHSDLQVVDSQLRSLSPSFWQYSNVRPQILDSDVHYQAICNSITGCAMLFNQAARRLALPFAPYIYVHDAWIGTVVKQSGGVLYPIEETTMLYRQHEENVVGATSYRFTLGDWRNKWMLAKRAYYSAHPIVWRNWLHFWLWKVRYFVVLHILQ